MKNKIKDTIKNLEQKMEKMVAETVAMVNTEKIYM